MPFPSDQIDAQAIARAAIAEGLEQLPVAQLDERTLEIRQLADHRERLVRQRVALICDLRWHLHDLDPSHVVRARGYVNPVWQQKTARWLARRPQCAQVRIARDEIARIREFTKAINNYERELAALVKAHSPQLLELPGCQTLTAAKLIGETGPINRFPSASKYARFTATAPIPASSGNTNRHRLDRGGNRQLNAAIHRIAITQIRWHPPANAYYQRKLTEGKTRKEALRCLKRQIIRTIYHLLRAQPPDSPTSTQPTALLARTARHRRRTPTQIICNPPIP